MKKNQNNQQQVSPVTYIQKNLQKLDMECYMSDMPPTEMGMTTVLVTREMPSGKFCVATYLLDIFCLGLKDTMWRFAVTQAELREFADSIFSMYGDAEYHLADNSDAHNLIFGAIDYAEELGFKPHKDFGITKHFLNEDCITDEIDEIEFGKNGKPFYMSGPHDNPEFVIQTLNRTVGAGNFDVMIQAQDDLL